MCHVQLNDLWFHMYRKLHFCACHVVTISISVSFGRFQMCVVRSNELGGEAFVRGTTKLNEEWLALCQKLIHTILAEVITDTMVMCRKRIVHVIYGVI